MRDHTLHVLCHILDTPRAMPDANEESLADVQYRVIAARRLLGDKIKASPYLGFLQRVASAAAGEMRRQSA